MPGTAIAFFREYWAALRQTPQIFRRIAFRKRTLEEELQEALLRGNLRKAFSGIDLWLLGLGIVIGSGWAQLTGVTAQSFSGPSIILSYIFSGLSMLLAATCFAELCIEYPVAGGAFSYVMINFGELAAFVTLGGLLLEYALGMAAVARGFSRYLARLCNVSPSLFVVEMWDCPPGYSVNAADVVTTPSGGRVAATSICTYSHSFDFMAAAIVMLMSVLLSLGVRESALFISGLTIVKVVMLVFIAIVGYTQAGPSCTDTLGPCCASPDGCAVTYPKYCELTFAQYCAAQTPPLQGSTNPFFDPNFAANGVFLGAAALFFTYTGMDAICNAAEEAQDVAHLPWAQVGTVASSMVLYVILAGAMIYVGLPNAAKPMLPPNEPYLTFISAFTELIGMKWMQYIISLAALSGIVTSLTVGLFSLSRIVMAASRDWLLPPFLARISPRTQTPLVAQMVFGIIIALLAMLVEVQLATALVSFGTLIALWIVCNVQLYRRYYPDVQLRFTRYGTVEVAPKSELGSWAPGRHFSLRTRRALVVVHLIVLNIACGGLAVYYAIVTGSYGNPPPSPPPPGPIATSPLPAPPAPLTDYYTDSGKLSLKEGYTLTDNSVRTEWLALAWFLVTLSFQLCCPLEYQPARWHIPWWLMPWLPSAAIGLVVFRLVATC